MEVISMKCPVCGKKVASIEISEQVWHDVLFREDGTFKFVQDAEFEPIGMLIRHQDDEELCDLTPNHELYGSLVNYFFNLPQEPPEEIAHLFED
jgi:hypothetical protein